MVSNLNSTRDDVSIIQSLSCHEGQPMKWNVQIESVCLSLYKDPEGWLEVPKWLNTFGMIPQKGDMISIKGDRLRVASRCFAEDPTEDNCCWLVLVLEETNDQESAGS